MEAKKTRRADLQNRRLLFMEIGLVIALFAVVSAFAWGQTERTVEDLTEEVTAIEVEQIINTEQEKPKPEVKIQPKELLSEVIQIMDNDVEITNEFNTEEFSGDFEIVIPEFKEEEATEEIPIYDPDELPTFQGGGQREFGQWVFSKLQYPVVASENGVEGTVNVRFVIERDGSLTGIEVLASPDSSLSDEAVRVLKLSPKWEPGKVMNRPVRSYFLLPIVFRLNR